MGSKAALVGQEVVSHGSEDVVEAVLWTDPWWVAPELSWAVREDACPELPWVVVENSCC